MNNFRMKENILLFKSWSIMSFWGKRIKMMTYRIHSTNWMWHLNCSVWAGKVINSIHNKQPDRFIRIKSALSHIHEFCFVLQIPNKNWNKAIKIILESFHPSFTEIKEDDQARQTKCTRHQAGSGCWLITNYLINGIQKDETHFSFLV